VLGWSSIAIGLSLAYSGVMMAVAQGALVGPLVKKIGERNAALLGLSLGSVAYVCYALAHAAWPLYLGMTLWAFGSLVSPACNAMMSQRIGADRQGELQGLVGSTYALASIVAPLALTQMFWRVGPSAPWIVSASLAALAVPIVLAAPRRTVALASNAP
jgi:DHA1 family tetracycline resistance protein-like MFS transporter